MARSRSRQDSKSALGESARHPSGWRAVSLLTLLAGGLKYHSARDFDGVVCETFVGPSEQWHVDAAATPCFQSWSISIVNRWRCKSSMESSSSSSCAALDGSPESKNRIHCAHRHHQ